MERATPEEQKRAAAKYEEGVEHFKAGRFAEAIASLRASQGIVASPNVLYMLGRALEKNGETIDAYDTFVHAALEAEVLSELLPKYKSTAEMAWDEVNGLRQRLGLVDVKLNGERKPSKLEVAERQVNLDKLAGIAVPPGQHEAVATFPDGDVVRSSFEVAAGKTTTVELDATPSPPPTAQPTPPSTPTEQPAPPPEHEPLRQGGPPLRLYSYVAAGVGAAGLATFVVAGSMARSTLSDLEDACPNDRCPADRQDDIDGGKTKQTIANVGLAVGVLGLGGAATLFFLDVRKSGDHAGGPAHTALAVGPGSLAVRGRF